jgi:hypothetical protein
MFVVKVLDGGVRVEAILVVGFIPIIAILGLLSGGYWAANFAAIVEESAGGNDTFSGPELIGEWFGYLLHLFYIGFCSSIPSIFVAAVVAGLFDSRLGMLAGLIAGLVLFPVFYLSSLTGNSRLAVTDRRVVGGFLRNPRSTLVLFLVSCLLASICFGLGYLIFVRNHFLLALLVGLCWSACLLIYARLLGRVAFVISQGGMKVRKRKKRRKKPTPGPDDWGSGTESPVAEKPVSS